MNNIKMSNKKEYISGMYDITYGYSIELKEDQDYSLTTNLFNFFSSYIIQQPEKEINPSMRKICIYQNNLALSLKIDPDGIMTNLMNICGENININILLSDLCFVGLLNIKDKLLITYKYKTVDQIKKDMLEFLDRSMIISDLLKKVIIEHLLNPIHQDKLKDCGSQEKTIHVSCINNDNSSPKDAIVIFTLNMDNENVQLFGSKLYIQNKETLIKDEFKTFVKFNMQMFYNKIERMDKINRQKELVKLKTLFVNASKNTLSY
jgi:hypothetical protein